MTKKQKLETFESLMNQAYAFLEGADEAVDGSSPVQDLMQEVDKVKAEVIDAIKKSK